jgi:hypothetical protein
MHRHAADHLPDDGDEVREQDRFLPIANISRIMKKALPTNAKIAKDAKETVQECVSEFISFVTSEGIAGPVCCGVVWDEVGFRDVLSSLTLGLQPAISASRRSAKPSTETICCGP